MFFCFTSKLFMGLLWELVWKITYTKIHVPLQTSGIKAGSDRVVDTASNTQGKHFFIHVITICSELSENLSICSRLSPENHSEVYKKIYNISASGIFHKNRIWKCLLLLTDARLSFQVSNVQHWSKCVCTVRCDNSVSKFKPIYIYLT